MKLVKTTNLVFLYHIDSSAIMHDPALFISPNFSVFLETKFNSLFF